MTFLGGISWQFLAECISTSVGLGNVWRFPFTAYRNGGGAFLIPSTIILLVLSRPLYFLELALGQFAKKNNVQVWDLSPIFRGTFVVCLKKLFSGFGFRLLSLLVLAIVEFKGVLWSIRWINWNQKLKLKTKNQIILLITFRLCYTL